MQEVAHVGEDHGQAEIVGGGDDFGVFDGAAGLNDSGGAGFCGVLDAVGEREEGVGGDDAALQRFLRFHDRDFDGVDAGHLAGADAEGGGILGEDDGVGFDVLADFPGELEIGEFGGGGCAFGDDGKLLAGDGAAVWLLDEDAAEDALELEFLVLIEAAGRETEKAEILFCGEDFFGAFGETGGGDAFDEEFDDGFGGVAVDDVIEGEDAAESGDGIAGEGGVVGVEESGLFGGAAGIVVLDDDGGGAIEFGDEAAGGFEVDVIIVGKFFALELFGGGEAGGRLAGGDVECGGLVGIFSVAKFLFAAKGEVDAFGEDGLVENFETTEAGGDAFEIHGDEAVVAGGGGKHFAGEFEAGFEGGVAVGFDFVGDAVVVFGFGDDGDAFEIFCGGAEHGGAADVDIFDELFGGEIGLGGGGFEGIEVDDDEIDGGDAVFGGGFLIFVEMAAEEQAAVNFGVEGFYATAKHFGPAGEIGDIFDGDVLFAEEFCGAAGGEEFDVASGETAGEIDDAVFVRNAEQGALDCHGASGEG